MERARWVGVVLGLALLASGCAISPEAARARGGGPGADIGNRREVVDIHGGTNPGHDVPVVGQGIRIESRAAGAGSTRQGERR